MEELSTLTVFMIVFICSYYALKWSEVFSRKNFPKGPWGFPIVGHLPFFGQYPMPTFKKWARDYGNVFRIRMGSWNAVVVNGYEAVKEAAEKADDAFSGRPNFVSTQVLTDRVGEEDFAFGTFSPMYVQQRKLATKALRQFTHRRQEFCEELALREVTQLASTLVTKYSNTAGCVEFDVQFAVASTLYHLLYGKDKQVDTDKHVLTVANMINEMNEFTGSGNPFDVMPWLRYVMPWRINKLRRTLGAVDELMFHQVNEHYKNFHPDHINDVADALLAEDAATAEENESKYSLNSLRLIMTLVDFQGAGLDTTHKTILWLILYMAAFPEVQKRVQAEIDSALGQDASVQMKDRPRLVYTDATIHEVMRIVTMLPLAIPHYSMKQSTIQGYDIDQDTVVIFNLHSVTHEESFWKDPGCFRPERLITDDNTLDRVKLKHVIAFSLGRRRCVGEHLAKINLFVFFVTLMQKCSFSPPKDCKLSLEATPGLVYTPKEFKLIVKAR